MGEENSEWRLAQMSADTCSKGQLNGRGLLTHAHTHTHTEHNTILYNTSISLALAVPSEPLITVQLITCWAEVLNSFPVLASSQINCHVKKRNKNTFIIWKKKKLKILQYLVYFFKTHIKPFAVGAAFVIPLISCMTQGCQAEI